MVSGPGIPFTFRLSSLVLATITLVSHVLLKEEVVTENRRIGILSDIKTCFLNKDLAVIFGCLFLVQAAVQATGPTLVLYLDSIARETDRDSALVSGIVYSVAGLGTVLGATLAANNAKISGLPRSNDSKKHRFKAPQDLWFFWDLMGSGAAVAFQGLCTNLLGVSTLGMVFGLFNGIVTVVGNVLATQVVPRDFRGRAFGVLNRVLPLGSVTGPILGGALGDTLGLGSSFYA